MQFQIKRDTLLKSLSVAHNIIERKNTIPILANVLLEIKNNILNIVATDLDIVFHDQISDLKIDSEGSTTTSATNILLGQMWQRKSRQSLLPDG